MDEARNCHDTDSYGRDDLPLVAKLADQANTFFFERLAELKAEYSERFSPQRAGGKFRPPFCVRMRHVVAPSGRGRHNPTQS